MLMPWGHGRVWLTCAGSSAAPPRLSGPSAGSSALPASEGSEASAASQGTVSDLRRKTGSTGGGRGLAGAARRVWWAAVLFQGPEGKSKDAH